MSDKHYLPLRLPSLIDMLENPSTTGGWDAARKRNVAANLWAVRQLIDKTLAILGHPKLKASA